MVLEGILVSRKGNNGARRVCHRRCCLWVCRQSRRVRICPRVCCCCRFRRQWDDGLLCCSCGDGVVVVVEI